MDTDKINTILEKQLKILGQKIRIDILKKLRVQNPLSFSKLQKEVLDNDSTSVNFSFHLKALKKCGLISSTEDGYSITVLGDQILKNILSIERILIKQNKTRMIRTSKYSKELFDINRIKEYLITEGGLEKFLAKQIAQEVENRLSKTNIEYLTAPLMREYINAILLENGLEEVRHKLTRLGTPPFEVFKLFNSKKLKITPEKFIKKLGSEASEQFLLLNLIPKDLADFYLSGEIALLHLNYWSLRPLSFYINGEHLLDLIFKKNSNIKSNIYKKKYYSSLIIAFFNYLFDIRQYFSEDLLLGDFNNSFLQLFKLSNDRSYFFSLFNSQLIRFNSLFDSDKPHLSLDFYYNDKLTKKNASQLQIDEEFLYSLAEQKIDQAKPLILFEYSVFNEVPSIFSILGNLISESLKNCIIFYNQRLSNLINATNIKITNKKENRIILDKILINLHMISIESNGNDDLFLDLLNEKLDVIFQLFNYKELLIKKKLNPLKRWNYFTKEIFENNRGDIYKNAIKSVSFFGLDEAVMNHCGVEIDRTENSELFALKIIAHMKKLINEKNDEEQNTYLLSQPHNGNYLENVYQNGISKTNLSLKSYSSYLIRSDSNLTLDKKIALYKRFSKIIDGGTVFNENISANNDSIKDIMKILCESDLNAISLKALK